LVVVTTKEGYMGCDCSLTDSVDIVADARLLPFKGSAFDYVYSCHVLEHFSYREVRDVMIEWARVLKKGGIIEVVCPWLGVTLSFF